MIFSETHRETGPIARLPTVAKLAALFALSILLFALRDVTVLGAIAALIVLICLSLCRPALITWLKSWVLLLTIVVVAAWTAFATGPEAALIVLLRLGALSLFATLVTTTTTVGAFIETITRIATPLERIGLANARDIGLAIGLVIRFVPEVHERYRAVADAHRARGLRLRLSTILVPMVISTLQSADDIANAIDARGIRTQNSHPEQG